MNILFVIPYFVPSLGFGGPVTVSFSLAKELIRRGHSVSVVTTDALDDTERIKSLEEVIDGIKIFRFRNISPSLAKNSNIFTPQGLKPFLKKHIREFDVVHLHSFFVYQNVIAESICRKYEIPYVLHLHESPTALPILGKVKIKEQFNKIWGNRILRNAKSIFVLSGREKTLLCDYLPELEKSIQIVPNALDSNLPKLSATRNEFGLPDNAKVILSLSRLSFIKRIDALIQAVAQLVQHDPTYHLLIAGPDESGNLEKLQTLTNSLNLLDHIHFLGQSDSTTRAKLFAISDVYALLSSYESFSISTLEALYYYVPVVLSKEVGIATDIIPLKCGLIVENAEDPVLTSKILEEVYYHRQEFKKNCQTAANQFSLAKSTDTIETEYKLIHSNRHP